MPPHTWVLPVNTMRKSHNHALSQHWYDCPQPRIVFSRLTQAKYHQITRKNSAYWQIDTSWLLSYIRFIQVPGRTVTRLDPDQSSPAILLSPNSFDSWKLVPDAKALVVTLEKQAISYLSVSGRIRVIDPYVFLGFVLAWQSNYS